MPRREPGQSEPDWPIWKSGPLGLFTLFAHLAHLEGLAKGHRAKPSAKALAKVLANALANPIVAAPLRHVAPKGTGCRRQQQRQKTALITLENLCKHRC